MATKTKPQTSKWKTLMKIGEYVVIIGTILILLVTGLIIPLVLLWCLVKIIKGFYFW
jgi:hypothetical protein